MVKILLIQPAYAHYRQELFDRLHTDYDVTFVFLRGKKTDPSHLSPKPEWKCITLNRESTRWWPIRLVRLLLQHKPSVIITSINVSLQTLLSILVGRLRRTPVVLWSESWGAPYRSLVAPWWKNLYRDTCTKWATARVNAVLASGTRCLEYHRRLGVAENTLFLAPNSTIDLNSLASPDEADQAPRSEKPTVDILYFSRIIECKGLDVLLRAFAGLASQRTDTHLRIAGEGPFRKYCEQLRDDLGIPNVHFFGSVPNEDAWKHYQQADIFVLPSSGKVQEEGWGLVINEALSMSLPVVATDAVGCVPDLVQHGRNGCVVAPGDVEALRQALRRLVEDPPCRERMGKESRAIFEEFNSYERAYRGLDSAIRFVLQQHTPQGRVGEEAPAWTTNRK